jgi:hypothetical protein
MVLGAAIYGGAVLISKVSQKMKLKKTGGDPKSVKWLK